MCDVIVPGLRADLSEVGEVGDRTTVVQEGGEAPEVEVTQSAPKKQKTDGKMDKEARKQLKKQRNKELRREKELRRKESEAGCRESRKLTGKALSRISMRNVMSFFSTARRTSYGCAKQKLSAKTKYTN